jgi:hypothetical protein
MADGTTTNWAPTAKVSVGVIAAAVVTLVTGVFWTKATGSEAAALTTLITFGIQYLVPERT